MMSTINVRYYMLSFVSVNGKYIEFYTLCGNQNMFNNVTLKIYIYGKITRRNFVMEFCKLISQPSVSHVKIRLTLGCPCSFPTFYETRKNDVIHCSDIPVLRLNTGYVPNEQ